MTEGLPDPISAIAPVLPGRSSASQRWSDLLFLHWRVDAGAVAPLLPEGLVPDVFDGSSWVGLIPFRLDRARVFRSPPVPYFGDSVERSALSPRELRYTSTRWFRPHARSTIAARLSTRMVEGDALANFLTARWGLFTRRRGRTLFLPNHHEPWTLYEASVIDLDDTLLALAGFPGLAERAPDSVLYSPGVETRFGSPS